MAQNTLSEYERLERQSRSAYNRRCINGRITGCGNCVGYCRFDEHPGFLTSKLREQHDCIRKACRYYLPKERANTLKAKKDNGSKTLLQIAQRCSQHIDDMRIMRARSEDDHWIIEYITVFGHCDPIDIERAIEDCSGVPVKLQKLNYSFDRCVELFLQ